MRDELKRLKARAKAEEGHETESRPRKSEGAMERSEHLKAKRERSNERKGREGRESLDKEAKAIANATDQPEDKVREHLEEQTQKQRWKLILEANEDGPFYRVRRLGEQKQVILNTRHSFFSKVYEVHKEAQPSIELLLFVLADSELDVTGAAEEFYRSARMRWSERLRQALAELVTDGELEDKANSVAESLYEEDVWEQGDGLEATS